MIKKVDRRERKIEEIRKLNLEQYYENAKVDDNNLMNLGLNMYIKKSKMVKNDIYSVFHQSKYDNKIVLHPQQAECIDLLFKNNNMILSAPTSFGKTYVAFEFIARNDFNNIVFIVPTIALMNEIMKKVKDRFSDNYNIITNSFEDFEQKNIFILVPERVDVELINKIKEVDFLIFDEIYKLKRMQTDKEKERDKRIIALNRGYFELVNRSKRVLLLGPFIKDVVFERTKLNNNIVKYFTDYSPVYNKIDFIEEDKNMFTIKEIEKENQKLIYFRSPGSIYRFCINNIAEKDGQKFKSNSLTEWCDKYISTKWLPSIMLKNEIGIHHGSLPTFMRKYIENMYNSNNLNTILCTSTLLEGINTPTNELIVYDSENLTAFEINNLIGRVGRLGKFKTGNIFLFNKELEKDIIGEDKYETIEIIAEDNKISDIEEVIYLLKDKSLLNEKQNKIINELDQKLKKYKRTVENLTETDGFKIDELISFIDNIPNIIEKAQLLYNAKKSSLKEDKNKETRYRGEILEIFMKIIPNRNKSINIINNNITNRIKSSVCVSQLLAKKPSNIYIKIQKQIIKQADNIPEECLNLYIDYLFDLAFKYIKYELSRIVKYYNFIFYDEYLNESKDKEIIEFINKEIIERFEMFNGNNNKIIKILLDLAIPYSDAIRLEKILKFNIDSEKISTSKVIKRIEEMIEKIEKDNEIEKVTKEILQILIEKK